MFNMTRKNGGGGGDSFGYTPINCLTVLNGSSEGYKNRFQVNTCKVSDVKKVVAIVKFDTTFQNCIWMACTASGEGGGANPYVNKSNGNACTVTAEPPDVEGFVSYTININANSNRKLVFGGAWGDATYSKTVSFKNIRGYDTNDELLFDLIPCVIRSGEVVMADAVAGKFVLANIFSPEVTIAGEAV